jgi:hypothetical protein
LIETAYDSHFLLEEVLVGLILFIPISDYLLMIMTNPIPMGFETYTMIQLAEVIPFKFGWI